MILLGFQGDTALVLRVFRPEKPAEIALTALGRLELGKLQRKRLLKPNFPAQRTSATRG